MKNEFGVWIDTPYPWCEKERCWTYSSHIDSGNPSKPYEYQITEHLSIVSLSMWKTHQLWMSKFSQLCEVQDCSKAPHKSTRGWWWQCFVWNKTHTWKNLKRWLCLDQTHLWPSHQIQSDSTWLNTALFPSSMENSSADSHHNGQKTYHHCQHDEYWCVFQDDYSWSWTTTCQTPNDGTKPSDCWFLPGSSLISHQSYQYHHLSDNDDWHCRHG